MGRKVAAAVPLSVDSVMEFGFDNAVYKAVLASFAMRYVFL